MSLTAKTLEHVVLAYNLPRGPAVDRGKVAQAAQKTAQAEAPHAALAAQADRIRTAMRLREISSCPNAAVTSLIPALSCRSCRPNAPFAELVRLSRTSIADEIREEHRRRVLGG